jgi:hypothetical protein
MCLTVVERQEVLLNSTALLHLLIADTFSIIILVGGVQVFCPVFLDFVKVLLPLVPAWWILLLSLHTSLFLFVAWIS